MIPLNEQFDRGFETPNHDHERFAQLNTWSFICGLMTTSPIMKAATGPGRPSATYLTPNLAVTLNSPAGVVSSAASRVS